MGSYSVDLQDALTKLADSEANGGTGISFDTDGAGSARVTISGEGEVRFSIADGAGLCYRLIFAGNCVAGRVGPGCKSGWNAVPRAVVFQGVVWLASGLSASRRDAGTRFVYVNPAIHRRGQIYDAAGNQLSVRDPNDVGQDCTYDALGRGLVCTDTGGDETSSSYDAAGRVLRKEDQLGDTVTYNYDLAGRLESRDYRTLANRPSGTIADTDSFTYDDAGRMLTAESDRYSNTVTYTYDDAGRKSTEATTISGVTYTTTTSYDDAGQVSGYTYTGREYDEALDLYHFRARMYDATTGRFCSRDPIGYDGHDYNVYRYVFGNPVRFVDYSGHGGEDVCVGLLDCYPDGSGDTVKPGPGCPSEVTLRAKILAKRKKVLGFFREFGGKRDAVARHACRGKPHAPRE